MKLTPKLTLVGLIAIILLGTGLRIYHLGTEDFWVDEIYTIQTAQIPLSTVTIAQLEPRDLLHFVYDFIIMHFWVKFGTNPWTVRLFSALVGIASIGLIYLIGKKLFDAKIGLLSALFLTLSSYHIYYSQEACAYAVQVLFILGMVYYFISGFQDNKVSSWIMFTMVTVLGIAVREFTILTWVALTIYAIVSITILNRKPNRFGIWLGSQLLIVIACIIGLLLYYNRLGAMSYGDWLSQPTFFDLGKTFDYFSLGWVYWTLPNIIQTAIVPLFIFILLFSLVTLHQSESVNVAVDRNPGLMLCWSLFAIPLILFYLISFKKPIFIAYRYLIIMLPFFYLLIAYAISKISQTIIRYIILAILISSMSVGTIAYHHVVKKIPWSKIAGVIDQKAQPNDLILIYEEFWKHGLQYYLKSSIPIRPVYVWQDLPTALDSATKGYNRTWLITVTNSEPKPVDEVYRVLSGLYQEQRPLSTKSIRQPGEARVQVILYSSPINR
ncbi:MAG: glycosyltransferase family 39 protein [bacterium]